MMVKHLVMVGSGRCFFVSPACCILGFDFSQFIVSVIPGEYMSGDTGKDVGWGDHRAKECERDGVSGETECNDRRNQCC